MKALAMSILATLLMTGCTTSGQPSTTLAANFLQRQDVTRSMPKNYYPPKNPQHIALFTQQKPPMPYRIIGTASVSRHNLIGLSRQEKTMHEMMKKLAASIGGDGLININVAKEGMQATIIQYQRIML